ncbi:MAG: hypothetical protein ACREP4_15600 [Stenotrophomonas sp.]|uniref:hypothetical protein n=1 Tax=Stenotrophomonas sp. TaxID=69392 RepID=UPI003D6D6C7F
MHDDALEIKYQVRGLTRLLYLPPPQWPGVRFEQGEELDVTLHVTEVGVMLEMDLDALVDSNDARVRQLVLAWELQLGRRLTLRRIGITSALSKDDGRAKLEDAVMFLDHCSATIVHAPAPAQMPQVPLAAERWVRTLAETSDFTGYVEEQLRRHYLIIEELWEPYASQFDTDDQAKQTSVRLVRNFVSHAECRSIEVVAFVSGQLNSAVVAGKQPPTVRFDRLSPEHRAFVARHEVESGRIARRLVHLAIDDLPSMPFLA